ncbi:hypothetical protein MJO29_016354 [Puccinia striiformis f. sp. tritici]|uniref:Scaffold protein Nfu/NifU N-terminal domain-containing protein n=3 Tax=Puccinia striiformis TaxID=27350 RepID=A0A0L0VZJ9_9BASI|nr:hypothetical protein Pst134EA_030604 [Puccinia striiformis f. sp. tritici]KAI9600656.1 hypothetical protein H4Q26_000445 [Puccinia striiformis f. sp. tritici PST-130]KNF04701.1 hypothetical protein PSTG_02185 [Puccinia striiformis f. sp. tritici PST-78]POW21691.1 hypothetical protein PSHT_02025 [Puccinia striiformis]KAH9440528.1 hypothetical protein Pst134EB_031138 [Puccinia striiformis f. sp. tritici]KAH9446696.1 hypothetical protein Pst134EA_030604 [Puccinia striiformis f. sp. tritici]
MSQLKNLVDRCSTSILPNLTKSTPKHSARITLSTRSPQRSYHNYSPRGQLRIKPLQSTSAHRSLNIQPSILTHTRSIFIQTEPTPNADALKFIPGRPVMKSGSREFLAGDDTRSSPLARSLLSVEGVKSVFFGPDFISINKESETGWPTMKPEIYSLLMEFFSASDRPVVQEGPIEEDSGPLDTRVNDDDSEVVAMIKELLDTRVRPAIQEDGGDLEYKSFNEETGVVQLMLKGSCRGCDSSAVTLKSGIERMLMHYVPEVQCVEQVQSEEEKMAEDEFSKFEARLRGGGKTVDI